MHIGELLIIASLVLSAALFALICISLFLKKDYSAIIKIIFYLSGIIISLSMLLLFAAFLGNRFDLTYVYNYSSKDLQLYYKLAGLWAGQEGTFLLWTFFLFIFGALIIRKKDNSSDIVLSVIVFTQFFILFILSRQSPFEYIWQSYNIDPGRIPADGSGLNPLLQDPWMIIHPPVLFLGYASACIPYGYAIAALIRKDYTGWIYKADKWIIFCTLSLGAGIFLGAYWAYKVLGWGGYWGWDPVENSSLIPWLVMIALMHGIILQKRNNALIKTNIFLAVVGLGLVFYGTFLTRSGILSDFSVHSFSDTGFKSYLVFYFIFILTAASFFFIKRLKHIKATALQGNFLKADIYITCGIVLILFYSILILIGTSMPAISKIFLPNPAAVNEKFYNAISMPFGIFILLVIIAAEIFRSQKNKNVKFILLIGAASAICGFFLNIFSGVNKSESAAYIFSFLGFFIILQNIFNISINKLSSISASRVTHLAIGVLIVGIVTSNLHSYSVQKNLIKDIATDISSRKLTFTGVKNTYPQSLTFMYNNDKEFETSYYISEKMHSLVREPYIDYGFFYDIYISPVEYKNNLENFGRILLSKDEKKLKEGITIRFVGFEIDKTHIKTENARLYAKLNFSINRTTYAVNPGLIIGEKGGRKNIDAVIPHLNRKVSLLDFDISKKEILLYIEPAKNAVIPPDSVMVEVSFKRLVWLVWLGTVLITIGIIISFKNKL